MTVFVDTSTLLAASWSAKGLSRLLIEHAATEGWKLVTADYCLSEVENHLPAKPFKRGARGEREERERNVQLSALFAVLRVKRIG